jgi:hypothetical protein
VSWDLYLVPRERADEAGEWTEEVVLEETADLEAAQEHARVVCERRPELEVCGSADSGSIRLCAPEASGLPVTVYLDGLHAELNVAYWDLGELASETASLVVDAVSALTEHTGWVIFDPQEDQVVGIADLRARKRVFALFGR